MKYLILLLLISCNEKYAPPRSEICTFNDNNLICNDLRKPKKEQTYERPYQRGDICTNADDYGRNYDYCSDLRERLIKAEKKAK
jgi:hypothetical protein